jgi:hypothetical protein
LIAEVGLRWWRRDAALNRTEDLMSKAAKKRTTAPSTTPGPAAKSSQQAAGDVKSDGAPGSKQSRVLAMLQSPTGATIAAMMKATSWQQHSVRGFLAGVVRKRLKLKLDSKKVDGQRIYQITGRDKGKPGSRQSKRQSP